MDLTFLENEVVHRGRISIKRITEEISSSPRTRLTNHWSELHSDEFSLAFSTKLAVVIEKIGSSVAPDRIWHIVKLKTCHGILLKHVSYNFPL